MKLISISIALIAASLTVSANPLNRATSDRYAEKCKLAEKSGQLAVAEEACYRALQNVVWGSLGPELMSERLYNLALIKRRIAKFVEAESLLTESLTIEESLSGKGSLKVARRIVELSINLAAQGKWVEGAERLAKAIPIAHEFSGHERAVIKTTFLQYGQKLRALELSESASKFELAASEL